MATSSPKKTNPLAHAIILPGSMSELPPDQRIVIGACGETISPQRLGSAMLNVLQRPSIDPERQNGSYVQPFIMIPRERKNDLAITPEGQAAQQLNADALKLQSGLEIRPSALILDANPPELCIEGLCKVLAIASRHESAQRSLTHTPGTSAIFIGYRDLLGMKAAYKRAASQETNLQHDKRTPYADEPAIYELLTVTDFIGGYGTYSGKEFERKLADAKPGDLVLWPITMAEISKSELHQNTQSRY